MPRRRPWDVRKSTRLRTLIVGIAITALVSVFIVRLADIQVVSAAELNEQSDARRTMTMPVYGARGDIVDVGGEVLATSVARWDVAVDPRYVLDVTLGDDSVITVGAALRRLADITGQDPDALARAVRGELEQRPDSQHLLLASGLTVDQYEQVRLMRSEWSLSYMYISSRPQRTYPLGAVGGNIVGFESADGEALAGMERMQDACLAPQDGSRTYERAADGTEIPGTVRVEELPDDGGTLQLTIDSELQYSAQEVLEQYRRNYQARSASAIILRADGSVAAIAEAPSVDPNNVTASDPQFRGSRSFTEAYEPGSTFKTITLAAMMDAGAVSMDDRLVVPSRYQRGDIRLGDSVYHPDTRWTPTGILVHSSNVGMVMMAEDFERRQLNDYFERFGFGSQTDIGFLGEQPVPFRDMAAVDGQTMANVMFGQGMAVTPIQMASSYLPFANDGVRPPIRLIESCTTADGEVITPELSSPVEVLQPETAQSMLSMMESVVNEGGHSHNFELDGYRIAAKTGTAEVARAGGGGYDPNLWIISATGVFPADDPQYVIHVMIDRPAPAMRLAGTAPAFHDIVNLLIRHYSIPPSTGEPADLPVEW